MYTADIFEGFLAIALCKAVFKNKVKVPTYAPFLQLSSGAFTGHLDEIKEALLLVLAGYSEALISELLKDSRLVECLGNS